MGYKNDLIHLKEYVLSVWHTTILWQSLLTWLTASDEIRVFSFDIHLTSSEYGIKHNLSQIKKLGVFRLTYCLSVLNMVWDHNSRMEMK